MLCMAQMMMLGCSRPGCSAVSKHLAQHVAVARMYAYQEGWRYAPGWPEMRMWCAACSSSKPATPRGGSESRRRLRLRPTRPAPYVGPASA